MCGPIQGMLAGATAQISSSSLCQLWSVAAEGKGRPPAVSKVLAHDGR